MSANCIPGCCEGAHGHLAVSALVVKEEEGDCKDGAALKRADCVDWMGSASPCRSLGRERKDRGNVEGPLLILDTGSVFTQVSGWVAIDICWLK